MLFTALVVPVFFATAAIAAPLEIVSKGEASLALGTRAIHARTFDQGDGFYMASFNNETGIHEVEFSSMEELTKRSFLEPPAATSEDEFSRRIPHNDIARRYDDVCVLSSKNVDTLNRANKRLAENAQRHGAYKNNAWGWVGPKYIPQKAYSD